MTNAQLGTLSAVELAAALTAGQVDITTVVAHLSARRLGETVAELVPLLPLLGEYTAAVMMAQQSLHQRAASAPGRKLAEIRRSQGSRNITVHAPVSEAGKKQWALTASRAGWRWIVQHADEIKAACDAADKESEATIASELVKKMQREAEAAAKKA